ncbi:hypothetical protein [Paraburkholderia acidiphila]|uniref:Uncharacterized protein n=1 Tax=Paraburkholderia acidiphila TaxID=2571747 RepID=A0A7Z2G3L5_9BURK|nr:hypothetical protein [Paraburkholderia acidiphila]QGZ54597.1 hypothetical protein FAZ97_06525 [Paraburkholderia acidiphila]
MDCIVATPKIDLYMRGVNVGIAPARIAMTILVADRRGHAQRVLRVPKTAVDAG